MKYEERLMQVRTSIAETQHSDEERRKTQAAERPSRARNVILGGGPHLLWKIPVLIVTITMFVMFPSTIVREANRYVHVPNWILNLVPGLNSGGSMPGPLALGMMGFAGLAIIVGGLGVYVWVRRAQNPNPPPVRW